tara:strand:+ start:856 stop:1743 length:888 start_codon:yes stop_codon:yes gene_type:complete
MATYDEMMMQFTGNLGTAGQKFTSDILRPYVTGQKTVAPPRKEVLGANQLQQQYFDQAAAMKMPDYFQQGVGALTTAMGTAGNAAATANTATGAYDPQSYQAFMDPFQKEVVDQYTKEMQRQFDISKQARDAQAQGAGAAFGDRSGVVEAEAQRGFQDVLGRGIAGLMSSGFGQAQDRAMTAFGNQMGRTLDASKIGLGASDAQRGIGTAFGQFGLAGPSAQKDFMDTLGKAGTAQYALEQAQKDSDFAQAAAQYKLPFDAFNLQSGIVAGFPSPQQFYPTQAQGGINPLMALFG